MHAQVTTATFGAKFRSKRGKYLQPYSEIPCSDRQELTCTEIFTFLTVDVKAYLPAMHTVTIYFLKDLITGQKKRK